MGGAEVPKSSPPPLISCLNVLVLFVYWENSRQNLRACSILVAKLVVNYIRLILSFLANLVLYISGRQGGVP